MIIVGVRDVDDRWPLHTAGFQKAIDRSNDEDWTTTDLWSGCRSGHLFLVEHGEAAAILRFENNNCRILCQYGKDWSEGFKAVADFARVNGKTKLVFEGRKGWERKLPVKCLRSIYEMDL